MTFGAPALTRRYDETALTGTLGGAVLAARGELTHSHVDLVVVVRQSL